MNVILSKDMRDFGHGKHKDAKLETFAHLVKVAINRYEKPADVKVTKSFEDKRLAIAKRLAMRSMNRDL